MDLTALQADVDFICSTSDTTYTAAEKLRNLNKAYRRIVAKILEWCNDWDFQEEEAYANLVANQAEYAFPSDLLKLKVVRVSYDGSTWRKATNFDTQKWTEPLDATTIADDFSTDNPYYDVRQTCGYDYITLFPTPSSAVTAGLYINYKFLNTDLSAATDTPKFGSQFHNVLSYYAALDWAIKNDRGQLSTQLRGDIQFIENDMRRFYSKRDEEVGRQMLPATAKKYSRQ